VRITWTLTGPGWADVRVGDDRGEAEVVASYISGAPEELLTAVTRLACGAGEARAQFEAEPTAFRWIFTRAGDDVAIRLLELPDGDLLDDRGTEVWTTTQPVDALVRAVVRCFDEVASTYGESGYEQSWRDPFPRPELERLRSAWRERNVQE
jgi:hypothetical protein